MELERGHWTNKVIGLYGRLAVTTSEDIDISGQLPQIVRIRLEIHPEDKIIWRTVPANGDGSFSVDIEDGIAAEDGHSITAQAWFDRTDLLGSSVSDVLQIKRSVLI